MKIIKYSAITIISLLFLLVVGIYAASFLINKSYIERQVSEVLGREFKVEGEISPQIGLNPTINITKAKLANAEWAKDKEMADIGEAEVTISLLSLIKGDVEINNFKLKDSNILLEEGKKWNFDFAKETIQEENIKEEDVSTTNISIDNIEIENLQLRVKQNGKTSRYVFDKLSLNEGEKLSAIELVANIDGTKINLETNATPISQFVSSKKIELKDMSLKALGYSIAGNLDIDLAKAKPYISGYVNIGDIDLASKKGAAKSAETYSKDALPFDIFNSLNADININIKSIKVNEQIKLAALKIPAKISGGSFKANNIKTNLANGSIAADVKLSSKSSALKLNIKNLEASKLIAGNDMSGGKTDIAANFNMYGNSVHALVNSLSGDSKIHVKNIKYSGEKKSGILKQLFNLLAGGSAASSANISCVISDVKWKNGTGEVQDLAISNEFADVTGTGKIKLSNQKLKLVLVAAAKNIGLTDLIVPPIAVSGKFDDISVYPDPQGTAVSAVKTVAGMATGVGIFAKLGEVVADKTGVSESLGLKKANPCLAKPE